MPPPVGHRYNLEYRYVVCILCNQDVYFGKNGHYVTRYAHWEETGHDVFTLDDMKGYLTTGANYDMTDVFERAKAFKISQAKQSPRLFPVDYFKR